MAKLLPILCVVFLGTSLGCGKSPMEGLSTSKKSDTSTASPAGRDAAHDEAFHVAPEGGPAEAKGKADPAPGGAQDKAKDLVPRKIVYTANISLITEDFPKAQDEIARLVDKYKGYVSKADVTGGKGTVRGGTWRLRVPAGSFEPFCNDVLKLGEPERNSRDSQDVTEEYFDLDNHLKTQQAELENLRKLMERVVEKSDKLDNLLVIRREINRVQDDLNRTQGRLKLLTNLSDLTTVNVTIREKQPYVQQKVETKEKVDFATRVGVTFNDSLLALKEFGEGVALICVAAAPWLPILLVAAIPVWWLVRRTGRGKDEKAVIEVQSTPPEAG